MKQNNPDVTNENLTYERLIGDHCVKIRELYDGESMQCFIQKGIQILQLHSVYQFKQKPFLKSYIEKNIANRRRSSNKMQSDMYKLLSNSIYGKLLCNQLNYSNTTYICEDKDKFIKRICKENFVNSTIFYTCTAL